MGRTPVVPEFDRALYALERALPELPPQSVKSASAEIWKHNSLSLFDGALSLRWIPRGKNWRWNQTKGKQQAYLPKLAATVELAKLVPRKSPKCLATIPYYKLWHLSIRMTHSKKEFSAFWCERGSMNPELESESGVWRIAARPALPLLSPKETLPPQILRTLQSSASRSSRAEAYNLSFICNP